jgi:predicted metal-dependent phosphoesterase TrpH
VGGAVDLHSHTTASDGTLTPRELVRRAVQQGVRVLAITDHDSTEGLREAMDEARLHLPLEIVPGLEINCDVPAGPAGGAAEVHVLGYCVDWEADWFQQFLREQRDERRQRVYRIAERLAALGAPIDPDEVFAIVKEGSAGRPHVAQVMVKRGYVKSVREAFDKYLRAGGPASVPRKRLTPAAAVAVIRRARGVPVLAHPGLADRDDLIPELVSAGLMGIETYYPEHSASQTAAYRELCTKLGLVATGGSDYHGPQIGRAHNPGTPPIPLSVWHELRSRAASLSGHPPSTSGSRTPLP